MNLFGIISRSPNLKLIDCIESSDCLPDLVSFDYGKIYQKYDNISFPEWAKEKKVVQSFYDIIMQPALSITLNEREVFSAAEMLSFMQIYFLTDSRSDTREVPIVNFYQALLKPWIDHLEKNNAKYDL